MKQLSDSIKRLRELDAKRDLTAFTLRVKEFWDERALASFHTTMDRSVEYTHSIQTINQLVELVAEMQVALEVADSFREGTESWKRAEYMRKQALTKADALLEGLKEK